MFKKSQVLEPPLLTGQTLCLTTTKTEVVIGSETVSLCISRDYLLLLKCRSELFLLTTCVQYVHALLQLIVFCNNTRARSHTSRQREGSGAETSLGSLYFLHLHGECITSFISCPNLNVAYV